MSEVLEVKLHDDAKAPQGQVSIRDLIGRMTLEEKIGQLQQLDASAPDLEETIRTGRVGSVINQADPDKVRELQRIAVEESRLGIPLLIGRDVIHGFHTIMPIPLGQAASWNPVLVEECARVAAEEAAQHGVNWTFAPMIDISRDARWGRIAESFGEDPVLTSVLGAAMIKGLQGERLDGAFSIAACAKHFAGYGTSEAGRDYDTTNIPENELRNIYLPPFKAALDAGVATFMSSFGDLDGVPASANEFLMRDILRDEWGFEGFVVSDWDSIRQLKTHGIAEDYREAAQLAAMAGIDMEMAGDAYAENLGSLVESGVIDLSAVDSMVENILQIKLSLGLFESVDRAEKATNVTSHADKMKLAKEAALESVVLLQNRANAQNRAHALPLSRDALKSLAVIGPMADQPYEQLGTWIFDGDEARSVTPLNAIKDYVGDDIEVRFAPAMQSTRSKTEDGFAAALDAASSCDAIIAFLGEESILSGEAHSRADINLPGNQAALIRELKKAGKPLIVVVLAGRPLTIGDILEEADAVLFAWHPGVMAGPAISDLLFGVVSPSGRLPVSFPKVVGQIPIYYNHKNTGRPACRDTVVHIDDIAVGARQTSFGMTAFHLDAGFEPQFPFGYGLSYSEFAYENLQISRDALPVDGVLDVRVTVSNNGTCAAYETVQLYVRDLVGSVTRPVKELKDFRKVHLQAGESKDIVFQLHTDQLAFFGRSKAFRVEPGTFHLWVGPNSRDGLQTEFRVI